MSVLIVTSLGDMVVDLYTDQCPLTCKNFLKLCKIKYYNGCLFHTVQKDFIVQTGDPTGTGSGGDSVYKFLYGDQARFFGDEIRLDLKHSKTGTVAMASAGENLNASQFYFTLHDDLEYLDGKHTVFGDLAEGLETLTRINEAYVDEKGRPYKNIRIKHTYILDDPFDDPPQLAELVPEASPEGKPKDEVDDDVRLEDDWVPMDEQLGPAELEEVIRAKGAHSSAVVLEAIGDIPDAEIKPPENVLFVCKLNPVTEDEDLHTIFSRFGTVVSAEIIRDYKTGDSLCYAFIEFETDEACEQAYFKMDNALIDDRRIHVDFSQSVSKLWSQYRRKDHQMGKGRGCFKCGALDHIARDCTGGAIINQQAPKYILKDDNAQHGGNDDSRYEMIFDGDTPESPKGGKRNLDHECEDRVEKQKTSRHSYDALKYRDYGRKDSRERHMENDRDRGNRADKNQECNTHQSSGRRRDREYLDDRESRESLVERRGNRDDDRRDDNEHRSTDSHRHGDRRDDREHRKRIPDKDSHGDSRIDSKFRKRNEDGDRRDRKDEHGYRKRSIGNGGHRDRRGERDLRWNERIDDDHDHSRRHSGDKRR
ncbi:peptidyl-prolyl cis-trans isomerase CYP59 [Malania oleifera]|uniref:peptidyl-prolyl cis-trans isomerase CYP59 n=1 Tax=Malania oleifera TaxID=397392 RepID=UPI0025AECA71|nr:peptidyl-prolyl cis-trans isomerase CYP59 [Malania oleifera]